MAGINVLFSSTDYISCSLFVEKNVFDQKGCNSESFQDFFEFFLQCYKFPLSPYMSYHWQFCDFEVWDISNMHQIPLYTKTLILLQHFSPVYKIVIKQKIKVLVRLHIRGKYSESRHINFLGFNWLYWWLSLSTRLDSVVQ